MSQSLNTVPNFDGSNYGYWKSRMRFFLKSIDVWSVIESGFQAPDKPTAEWSIAENKSRVANDKAMNALFLAISQTEHSRISNCDSAKDAWEILETTYEGTNLVKAAKLQMLVSKFEKIEMLEDETFDDFFGKLSEIRNSMINLGKKVSDTKIVRKVMRSLPERFKMKVTTIESCTDLETMRIEELVGALQTYEFSLSKPRNNKDLALRTLRKNSDELSDEEPDDEELALVARKFYKFRHRFPKRLEKLEESYKDRNERDPCGPKCYECSGYGHLRKDCANLMSNKPNDKKAFNITMSDTDEEVLDDSPNYVAFGVSYDSDDSNQSDDKSASDNESNRVSDLQNSFENLRENFSTIRNTNLKLVKDVKNLELERDNLLKELSDSHAVCNSLKSENHVLIAKSKSLQNDLIETINHLSTFSSEKLNQMLHAQKRSSDRSGLGFDKTASCSSNHASTSKIVFVKPVEVEKSSGEEKPAVAPTQQGKKGKKNSLVSHASYPKPKVVHPPRKLPSQRFVPTCHHCGKVGHIRPHCFNLKPHVQKNKNSVSRKDCEGLVTMMKGVLSRLDQFEKVHKPRPKITQVWVRKDDTIHPFRGSGNELTLF
jgi:hypothetical protein